jgi:hypothetical protein
MLKRLWPVFFLEGQERYTAVFDSLSILLEIKKFMYGC